MGLTKQVQRHLAIVASDWQRSFEAEEKDVHSLLHPSAFIPIGPAAPSVCKAAELMEWSSKASKMTEFVGLGMASVTHSQDISYLLWTQ